MEDKKGVRHAGPKVSQIANIFQPKLNIREDIISTRTKPKMTSPPKEVETSSVSVMRTESHVTRFNNARALFEKLGEENRTSRKDRIIPLQSTKSASSILDVRSRSSSANSEIRETKSHDGSRSPSPQCKDECVTNISVKDNSVNVNIRNANLMNVNSKNFNMKNINSKNVNSKNVYSKDVYTKDVYTKNVNSKNVNAKNVTSLNDTLNDISTNITSSNVTVLHDTSFNVTSFKEYSTNVMTKNVTSLSDTSSNVNLKNVASSNDMKNVTSPSSIQLNFNKTNGHNVEVLNEASSKINGNDLKCNEERSKPSLMKKPEKPERKFNSKELIEKQRNWTSHFSKTRTNRYSSDPVRSEIKVSYSNGKEPSSANRSASFNNKVHSPPISPTENVSNDVNRRYNVIRKERPASVIPTTSITNRGKDYTSPVGSPVKTSPVRNPCATYTKKERNSLSNIYNLPLVGDKSERERLPEPPVEDIKISKSRSPCQDGGQIVKTPPPKSPIGYKSALEEKEASKENLSCTSGSLSSLSPPSSPTRLKTESEKQELEGSEKIFEDGKFTSLWCTYNVIFLS